MKVSRPCWLIPAVFLLGCSSGEPTPADTGSREAVRSFYSALMQKDDVGAYDLLHPDEKARLPRATFARLAANYRRGLGFEPTAVHIRACEEQGAQAKAHVVLSGHQASRRRQYRDALTLRRGPEGWGIVLPRTFGRSR
jgi:hypothetical protein